MKVARNPGFGALRLLPSESGAESVETALGACEERRAEVGRSRECIGMGFGGLESLMTEVWAFGVFS